ncbi:26S proteasome regulatory subunit 6B, partial [Coemansia sp. RSA 2703]
MEEIGIRPVEIAPGIKDFGVSLIRPELLGDLDETDLYLRQKRLERHLELLDLQEEYIKDEQRNLQSELLRAQEEVKRIRAVPLVLGQFLEPIDRDTCIISSTAGSTYFARILSTIDRELLKPNTSISLHRHSNAVVE